MDKQAFAAHIKEAAETVSPNELLTAGKSAAKEYLDGNGTLSLSGILGRELSGLGVPLSDDHLQRAVEAANQTTYRIKHDSGQGIVEFPVATVPDTKKVLEKKNEPSGEKTASVSQFDTPYDLRNVHTGRTSSVGYLKGDMDTADRTTERGLMEKEAHCASEFDGSHGDLMRATSEFMHVGRSMIVDHGLGREKVASAIRGIDGDIGRADLVIGELFGHLDTAGLPDDPWSDKVGSVLNVEHPLVVSYNNMVKVGEVTAQARDKYHAAQQEREAHACQE